MARKHNQYLIDKNEIDIREGYSNIHEEPWVKIEHDGTVWQLSAEDAREVGLYLVEVSFTAYMLGMMVEGLKEKGASQTEINHMIDMAKGVTSKHDYGDEHESDNDV